jgi:hypothetical protein
MSRPVWNKELAETEWCSLQQGIVEYAVSQNLQWMSRELKKRNLKEVSDFRLIDDAATAIYPLQALSTLYEQDANAKTEGSWQVRCEFKMNRPDKETYIVTTSTRAGEFTRKTLEGLMGLYRKLLDGKQATMPEGTEHLREWLRVPAFYWDQNNVKRMMDQKQDDALTLEEHSKIMEVMEVTRRVLRGSRLESKALAALSNSFGVDVPSGAVKLDKWEEAARTWTTASGSSTTSTPTPDVWLLLNKKPE